MNLEQQLADLQARSGGLVRERAERMGREVKEYLSDLPRQVEATIAATYESLSKRILQEHFGLGDEVDIDICPRSDYVDFTDPNVQALVRKCCGLNLTLTFPNDTDLARRYMITVNLRDEVKTYSVELDGKTVLLDFPMLFAENQRRNQLWKASIDQLAREAIDRCRRCLDQMPDKFYGIQDVVMMYDQNWRSYFDDCISFDGKKIPYWDLGESRLKELEATINAMLSGGEIRFHCDSMQTRILADLRRRVEKVVENPYFDYQEFCETYDAVTAPLQKVFDDIAAGLKLVDAKYQIMALWPIRMLIFDFSDYAWDERFNYAAIKRCLNNKCHQKAFFETVEKAIPGIRVRFFNFGNLRCIQKGEQCRAYEQLWVRYDIMRKRSGVVPDRSDLVVEQLKTEQLIRYIKAKKVSYVARSIINILMDQIREESQEECCLGDCKTREFSLSKFMRIELSGKAAGYCINMTRMTDDECKTRMMDERKFIGRVQQEVNRLSDGMLLLDVASGRFRLNFDKTEAAHDYLVNECRISWSCSPEKYRTNMDRAYRKLGIEDPMAV